MTYYEKMQNLYDEVTTKAIDGNIAPSIAISIQNYFEKFISCTMLHDASKEVRSVHRS